MEHLKGKISNLKEKARADSLRRKSQLSVRTPSPFTAAENWYSSSDSYKGSPLSADAGVGWHSGSDQSTPVETSHPVSEAPSAVSTANAIQRQPSSRSITSAGSTSFQSIHSTDRSVEEYEDAVSQHSVKNDEYERRVDALLEQDDLSSDCESEYEEAIEEQPERHEDRADAFDYEHFFLHSAMGSYSGQDRRGSSSSTDSAETTKPANLSRSQTPRATPSGSGAATPVPFLQPHMRKESNASISSTASFETATEGLEDEEEDMSAILEEDLSDENKSILDSNWTKRPKRSSAESDMKDSGIGLSEDGGSEGSNLTPRLPKRPGENELGFPARASGQTASSPPANASKKELFQTGSGRAFTDQEKQLVDALVTSFEHVCQKIRSMPENDYDTRLWRRRLDQARRVLDAEWAHT